VVKKFVVEKIRGGLISRNFFCGGIEFHPSKLL
jgi:hypothetical protein